jgi:hypothetical protein
MRSTVTLAAFAAICLGSVSPAMALNNNQADLAEEFALNNSTFVLYHEVGHLFVDQFQLPVLGAREEDAADALATLMLLDQQTDEASRALRDSVDGWMLTDNLFNQGQYDKYDFYDPHSIDMVRAYAIACLAVGANYNEFHGLTLEIGMEDDRASSCVYDYELTRRSWSSTLEPHRSGAKANDVTVNVVYDKPNQNLAAVARLIQNEGLLEEIATQVSEHYDLKRGVTFRATNCGVENAFYDPEANEVQLCYEYVKMFFDIKAAELERTGEGTDYTGDTNGEVNKGDDSGDKNGETVGVPNNGPTTKTKDKL